VSALIAELRHRSSFL